MSMPSDSVPYKPRQVQLGVRIYKEEKMSLQLEAAQRKMKFVDLIREKLGLRKIQRDKE